MYRMGLLVGLLLMLVGPVCAAEVHISDPKPLMCGSGNVFLHGIAKANTGDQFYILKVYFKDCTGGCAIGPSDVVLTRTLTKNGQNHSWSVFVPVTQGQTYSMYAVVDNAFGGSGPTHMISQYAMAACDENELLDLQGTVQDRLDTIP